MARILVVDDDPDMRALIGHYLRPRYDVAVAEGAHAARTRIAEQRPDLILVDINMPEVTGDELVAGLREDAALAAIPVVYITGERTDTELAVRTLGYPLLTKPLAAKELLATVAQQLPRRATRS